MYDGPVPVPGTMKSRLAHWYVRADAAQAHTLWWHRTDNAIKVRQRAQARQERADRRARLAREGRSYRELIG